MNGVKIVIVGLLLEELSLAKDLPYLVFYKECFQSFSTGMYLQKQSPFMQKFNDVIGGMASGGLTNTWFFDAIAKSNQVKFYFVYSSDG